MATIVTRAGKGSPLTNAEVDANFLNLNAELATKQGTLVSGTSIKTVNGQSVLGSGNIQIDGGVTSFNTRTGAITLSSGDVTGALGFTPYNATNPSGYITSSGSISGNAATATALQTARTINGVSFNGTADVTISDGTKLPLAGGTMTGGLTVGGNLGLSGNPGGVRVISPTAGTNTTLVLEGASTTGASANIELTSDNLIFLDGTQSRFRSQDASVSFLNISSGATNVLTGALQQQGNQVLHAGNYTSYAPSLTGSGASGTWAINISGSSASTTGNAATATALQTARAINGTNFNGSANITTANWGTARTLTVGSTGKSVNGSANVAWTLAEIGAAATSHTQPISSITGLIEGTTFSGTYPVMFSIDGNTRVFTNSNITYTGATNTLTAPNFSGALSGNATTATTLQTARTINGVSFNGSANITLPTVNTSGNQTISGTKTFTGLVEMGGSGTISTPSVLIEGNNAGTGAVALGVLMGTTSSARNLITASNSNGVVFRVRGDGQTVGTFSGALSGNATTATTLQTARSINGVSFNGSANITVADATKVPLAGGTMTGTLTVPNLTVSSTLSVRAAIDLADNDILRLGSSDDWEFFHNGTANYMDLNVGNLIIRDNSTTRFTFGRTTGSLTATGNITAYSDERLKKDWTTLPADFIERLATTKSGTYTRTDIGDRQAGASAQDWQALLPEVVSVGSDDQKTLSLAYGNAALVSAIELAKRLLELEKEFAVLKEAVRGPG
jgi:hypothetical protein